MKKNVQAPLGEKDGTLQPFPGSAYSYCGNRFSKQFDFFCFFTFFPVFCLLPFFTFQPILLSLILPVFTVAFCALGLLVHYADFEHTNQCWINSKIHHLCICVNEIDNSFLQSQIHLCFLNTKWNTFYRADWEKLSRCYIRIGIGIYHLCYAVLTNLINVLPNKKIVWSKMTFVQFL